MLISSKKAMASHPVFMTRTKTITQCTEFKFVSLFHFQDSLTGMFSLFHIPFKVISSQVHAWSLIPTPF